MVKKPLIVVCLCAVVLLVLSSLSNVVGYQSVKSTASIDSPLFNIRTQKAISQDSKILLTSGYLGKGRNAFQIPMPDNRTVLYQKIVEKIRSMDEATFNNLITMIMLQKNHVPTLKNINSQYIITVLYQIKNNQNSLLNLKIDFDADSHQMQITSQELTVCLTGCILYFIVSYICFIVATGFIILLTILKPKDCDIQTSFSACCH